MAACQCVQGSVATEPCTHWHAAMYDDGLSFNVWDYNHKDKTVVRPFIFMMGISIQVRQQLYVETALRSTTTTLYWDGPQMYICICVYKSIRLHIFTRVGVFVCMNVQVYPRVRVHLPTKQERCMILISLNKIKYQSYQSQKYDLHILTQF